MLSSSVGDDVGIVGDGDGGTDGVVGSGVNGGGGDEGCHEASEPATDRSPSPSSCGISAISRPALLQTHCSKNPLKFQ